MSNARPESNGNACRNILCREVGLLPHSASPHDSAPDDADHKLRACDEPVSMDHIRRLLVVDVVECVARIPCCHETELTRG